LILTVRTRIDTAVRSVSVNPRD